MPLTVWQQQHWPAVERDIADVVEQLRQLNPLRIVLFGSYARGDFSEDSDVDLLIVLQTRDRVFERVERVLELVKTRLPIEPLVYTPAELDELRSRSSAWLQDVEHEGRVLYERA